MSHIDPTYRYLNLEGTWPLVQRDGLAIGADGSMSLAKLPSMSAVSGSSIPPVGGLTGPFGIGADACGNFYVADPVANRILRIDTCDGSVAPLRCFGGIGSAPGQLDTPRGVAVSPRGILLVADSGNHRVQLVDLATGQLRGLWGSTSGIADPWDLAVDSLGKVYVADAGTLQPNGTRTGATIVKLNAEGERDATFSATFAAQTQPGAPTGVAIAMLSTGGASMERLLVLDAQPPRLLAYQLDGTLDSEATSRWATLLADVTAPVAVTASSDRLYVGDADTGRVLVFDHDGKFLGEAAGSSVAGLALDCHGRLVAHPGAGGDVQLSGDQPAYAECGTFLAGPFEAPSEPTRWWQLRATIDDLPSLAHVRFFTYTSDTMDGVAGNVPSLPVTCALDEPAPSVGPDVVKEAPIDSWRAAPWDARDLLILNAPARWLWIAGIMHGDGTATPVMRQMRVEFDVEGWMRYLPAIFSRDDASRVFLERALALFQVPYDDEASLVDDIALLSDPFAASDATPHPTWLEWLATWVQADLEETWSAVTRRQAIADAFRLFARRGTKETIRRLVAMHTGATPRIEELFSVAGPWALGVSQGLGFGTILTPEPAEGAVLGSTAVADHSRLLADEDYGVPAYEDVAHRFLVYVYSAELSSADQLRAVRRMLDQEKPAHTTYELCVIEPRMRVGLQSLVGVDAIVGGAPLGGAFDGTRALGLDAVLPDAGRVAGGIIGDNARVGQRATVA